MEQAMKRIKCSAWVIAGVLSTGAFASAPVGYAQSTGYFKKDSRPTLYQPLNLLDAREATVWCTTTSDPLTESLSFGFKGIARIDEVRIYTGNGSDDSSFQEYSRAKKFALRGPTNARQFTVADQRGMQAISLDPPMVGSHFVMEVLDLYPAEDPEMPVCVTDIVFYSDGKPLNGAWMTERLKYNKARAALLGTWFAGYDGAPDRYLSFYFDGTYRVVYDPYEKKTKDRAFAGLYTISGNRVSLQVPGKGRITGKIQNEKSKGDELTPASEKRTLVFDGDRPEDLKQAFRDKM
jgi:hypothetical protein